MAAPCVYYACDRPRKPTMESNTIIIRDITQFSRDICKELGTKKGCHLKVVFQAGAVYPTSKDNKTYSALFSEACSVVEVHVCKNATVPRGAFYGCDNLQTVTIDDNAKVYEGAFGACTGLKKVTLGDCVWHESSFQFTHIDTLYFERLNLKLAMPFDRCKIRTVNIPNSADDLHSYLNAFNERHTYPNQIIFRTPLDQPPQRDIWLDEFRFEESWFIAYAYKEPSSGVIVGVVDCNPKFEGPSNRQKRHLVPLKWQTSLHAINGDVFELSYNSVEFFFKAIEAACEELSGSVADVEGALQVVKNFGKNWHLRAVAKTLYEDDLGKDDWNIFVADKEIYLEDINSLEDILHYLKEEPESGQELILNWKDGEEPQSRKKRPNNSGSSQAGPKKRPKPNTTASFDDLSQSVYGKSWEA